MRRRYATLSLSTFAAMSSAIALWSSRASASFIDFGAEGGVLKRSLSDVDYKTSFTWQLHGEIMFFPLLMMGPYATFASSAAEASGTETSARFDFRTIGLRAK